MSGRGHEHRFLPGSPPGTDRIAPAGTFRSATGLTCPSCGFRDSWNSSAGAAKHKVIAATKSGWQNFVSSPSSSSKSPRPNGYRPGFVVWERRMIWPLRDVSGSIARGLARHVAIVPGLGCKCPDARSRDAATPVDVTRVRRDAGISVCRRVMARRCMVFGMVFASHSGSCEHRCSDQPSRQKFKPGHSISPCEMRSQRVTP
jgi:hypothetical protein